MHDHAGLADGESKEDPDGVRRDQQGDKCVGRNQEDDRACCDGQDSARVCKSITALSDLAREEPISRQDARKLRAAVESGVGGEEQDPRGRDLEDRIRDAAPERRAGDLGDQRLAADLLRNLAKRKGEQRHPEKDRCEEYCHDRHGVRGILRLRLLECRNAVGDRLSPRQCDRAVGERLEQQERKDQLHAVVRLNYDTLAPVHRRIAERDPQETDTDDRKRTPHEKIGGNGKEASGLSEAAQVGENEQEECAERELDTPREEFWERRRDGGDTRCRAHGGGEDVVDDKARCRHQRRNRAKGAGGHRICPTAFREAEADLAVADGHDPQEEADGQGDHGTEGEIGGARRGEHDEDLFAGVGTRGDRVR